MPYKLYKNVSMYARLMPYEYLREKRSTPVVTLSSKTKSSTRTKVMFSEQ